MTHKRQGCNNILGCALTSLYYFPSSAGWRIRNHHFLREVRIFSSVRPGGLPVFNPAKGGASGGTNPAGSVQIPQEAGRGEVSP